MNVFSIPDRATWTPPPPDPFEEIAAGRTTLAKEFAAGRVRIESWGCDQTDLGASDDRPCGPDSPIYRQGSE